MIEICVGHGIPCDEEDLSLTDVYRADELFCTGTMGELAAVTEVDGRTVGNGEPGPLTGRLAKLFEERAATEGTPVV